MEAQRKDPQLVAQIQDMIERGMDSQQIADVLVEQTARKEEMREMCNQRGGEDNEDEREFFPDEIVIASQAVAYRDATPADISTIAHLINSAYEKECAGKEAFRSGLTVTEEQIGNMFADDTYRWLLLELPCGMNIEKDGAVLGVCCYTTEGVCRKNGEIEGKLGSIRYMAVVPRYHGVLIGHRFLRKLEDVLIKEGCCRIMTCIPETRVSLIEWLLDRQYTDIKTVPYPVEATGHRLLKDNTKLVVMVKPLQLVSSTREVNAGEEQNIPPPQNSHLPPHWRGINAQT